MTKNSQNMMFCSRTYHNRVSRRNQTIESCLRPLALASARPLTLRQPLLQAWTSAVDPQRTIPLCSLLCGHTPCHFGKFSRTRIALSENITTMFILKCVVRADVLVCCCRETMSTRQVLHTRANKSAGHRGPQHRDM